MTFFSFVLRNIARQRLRTTLTVVGIAVGITTVVALGAVASGLRATAGAMLRTGGADFIVAQKGSADLTFSSLSQKEWDAVAGRPDVERATGVLMSVSRLGSNPYFALLGVKPAQLTLAPPTLVRGQLLRPGRTGDVMRYTPRRSQATIRVRSLRRSSGGARAHSDVSPGKSCVRGLFRRASECPRLTVLPCAP